MSLKITKTGISLFKFVQHDYEFLRVHMAALPMWSFQPNHPYALFNLIVQRCRLL